VVSSNIRIFRYLNRLQIFSGGKWELGSSLPSPWLASCGAGLLDYFLVLGGTRNQLNRKIYNSNSKFLGTQRRPGESYPTVQTPLVVNYDFS